VWFIAAGVSSFKVQASVDGGASWVDADNGDVVTASDVLSWQMVTKAFFLTGSDIRVRFLFNTGVLIAIHRWKPKILVRGESEMTGVLV